MRANPGQHACTNFFRFENPATPSKGTTCFRNFSIGNDLFTTMFTVQMGRGKIQWAAFTSVCWLFIFKVTEPNSIPYRTHSACAKRAAYPDPPPVIPLPESGVAEVTHLPSPRSLGEPRPNRLSSEPGSASGPKCFQVLGLSPSLLQNPMM